MCITRDNLDKSFPKRHFQAIFKMDSQKINTFIGFETGKKKKKNVIKREKVTAIEN